jgi:DnaJ-class molecular chaperone
MPDYYNILGIKKTNNIDEIKAAYKKLASIYHPDKNDGRDDKFIEINEAYQILSDPVKRGHVRRFRKGFNTTNVSKINACAKLKQMVEQRQIKINSRSLISELKTFIARGVTFEAKETQHDDLVAAFLLAIRMMMMLGDWDPAVYAKMTEDRLMDEMDLPMPIYINSFN